MDGDGARPEQKATVAGLAAVLLWCWTGPLLAAGTRSLGPMTFLALSSAVGAVVGALLHVLRGHDPRHLVLLPPRVLAAGLAGVAAYTMLLAEAVALAEERDLGQVVLVNYLWPVLIVLLGAVLLRQRQRRALVAVAVALGFAGVAVSRGLDTFVRPPASLLPHGLALLGASLWALYSVLLRRWRVPDESCGAPLQFAICSLAAAAIAASRGETQGWADLPLGPSLVALAHGVGPVGLGYPLWEIGMKRGDTGVLAVVANSIPVVSAALVALLFGESASLGLLAGALLIAASAAIGGRASQGPRGLSARAGAKP